MCCANCCANCRAATGHRNTPRPACRCSLQAKGKYGATEEKGIYPEVSTSLADLPNCCARLAVVPKAPVLSAMEPARARGVGCKGNKLRAIAAGPSLHCRLLTSSIPSRTHPFHLPLPAKQDVLKYYGASKYGSGPPALGSRSPRESFNPEADAFLRERGSYQTEMSHP